MERASIDEAKKARWREVLVPDFMSSEDSGVEQLEDERSRTVFYIKPLPWRHPQVTKFFHQLDERTEKQKSRRSTDKMLPRSTSREISLRIKPHNFPSNFWGYDHGKQFHLILLCYLDPHILVKYQYSVTCTSYQLLSFIVLQCHFWLSFKFDCLFTPVFASCNRNETMIKDHDIVSFNFASDVAYMKIIRNLTGNL